jgi:polyisoprenoid-binding protein YceI
MGQKSMILRICGGWRWRIVALTAAFSLPIAGLWNSQCRAETYSLDTKLAEVRITYDVGLLSQSARFEDVTGTAADDDKTSKLRRLEAVIKTASLTAPEPVSENQLKGSDFLDVANHPEIRFKSQPGQTVGADGSTLSGELTMKGVTRPITLQAHFYGAGVPLPQDIGHPETVKVGPFFTATARISRSEFNMTAYHLLVSDEISIQISGPLERMHATESSTQRHKNKK